MRSRGARLVMAWLFSSVTALSCSISASRTAVRSTTRVSMPNCSARARPSSASMPKLRLEAQGIMTPTVFSQAALHRIPTRALSLPPELPNTMPETPELFTSSRMKLTRPSNSA